MGLSDLLLLTAIVLVAAILGTGGYVLIFKNQFSFLKRPYAETEARLSRRLGIPTGPPADTTAETAGTAGQHPGAAIKMPQFAIGIMEVAGELTAVEHRPDGGYEPSAIPSVPRSYGECAITASVRDPYWLFAYWETDEARREQIARRYGCLAWDQSRPVLRVYDATNLYFFDSRRYMEISVEDYANNWYIQTGRPNKTFCVELGRVRPDGSYIFLARSNFVSTPSDRISEVIDEEWLLLPEYATRLYRRIGGSYPGPSSSGLLELDRSGGGISSPFNWQSDRG
jgi:hypothetical protein